MFEIQPSILQLEANREQVLSIHSSINHPQVAVPGKTTQKAEAFVVALREAGDLAVVFVCLWLDQDRHQVVYGSAPVDRGELEGLTEEGLGFCESMGFIMEDVPFTHLDAASQDELLTQLPPFSSQRGRLASSLVGSEHELSPGPLAAAEPTGDLAPQSREREQVDVLELSRLGRFLARF